MNLGPTELVIILVIALIVFGPRKLPDLGKTLGQAMAQFRRASDDFKRSWEQEVEIEKTRLDGVKQDLGSGLGYDSAGDDFNYSMDPNRGETDLASAENSTSESGEAGQMGETGEASENGAQSYEPANGTSPSEVATPEPATATVARDSSRSEPWI